MPARSGCTTVASAAKKQRTQGTEAGKEQGAETQLRMRPAAEEQEEEEEEKKPLQKRPAGTGARSSGKLPAGTGRSRLRSTRTTRPAGKEPAKEQEEEPAASAYEIYLRDRALVRERFHTAQSVARALRFGMNSDRLAAARALFVRHRLADVV